MDSQDEWGNFDMEKFSVLISVYHKEKSEYLDQCLESIWLTQTLKPDEIVLVQDGPITKELEEIISKWHKIIAEKLIIKKLETNSGLATALNYGLSFCSHDLIARMDSDDISMPDRFKKQVHFMTENLDIAASSAQIEEWNNELTQKTGIRKLPTRPIDCENFAKYRSPINHPCAIFRKNVIEKLNGYPKIYPEDYALWGLLLKNKYKITNLPDTLLKMRVGQAFAERRGFKFLKGEIALFRFFLEIGFINKKQYMINITTRSIVRLSPKKIKLFMYNFLR